MSASTLTPTSTWSPLRQPIFRALWIASAVSTIGTWMHDVGAAWLMTSLSPSPFLVALMQAASSLPFFLLALPAGAIADVVDRRRMGCDRATHGNFYSSHSRCGRINC